MIDSFSTRVAAQTGGLPWGLQALPGRQHHLLIIVVIICWYAFTNGSGGSVRELVCGPVVARHDHGGTVHLVRNFVARHAVTRHLRLRSPQLQERERQGPEMKPDQLQAAATDRDRHTCGSHRHRSVAVGPTA